MEIYLFSHQTLKDILLVSNSVKLSNSIVFFVWSFPIINKIKNPEDTLKFFKYYVEILLRTRNCCPLSLHNIILVE